MSPRLPPEASAVPERFTAAGPAEKLATLDGRFLLLLLHLGALCHEDESNGLWQTEITTTGTYKPHEYIFLPTMDVYCRESFSDNPFLIHCHVSAVNSRIVGVLSA